MSLYKLIHESERKKVLEWVASLSQNHSKSLRILDIGCGFGANLVPLQARGHAVTGIEVNPSIVQENRKNSLRCFTPEEYKAQEPLIQGYDLLILSHVIEHFAPDALVKFVDEYLDHLSSNGHLLIATPLMSSYFYDDFDHVKPYQPTGILMVFGGNSAQVQYYSRNKLLLKNLWFRKSYFRIHHARGRHLAGIDKILLKATDWISIIFYLLSFRTIGKKDGWVGLFQKIN